MLGTLVEYLHNAHVPFRLSSYPSAEEKPIAAHALPPGAMLVETRLLTIAERVVVAAFPSGEEVDLAAVANTVGAAATHATPSELPDEIRRAGEPVPPLGQLLGVPILLDVRAASAAMLVFRAFGESAYVEVPYDDWARLEQPRVASFASAGELAQRSSAARGREKTEPATHRPSASR
ncbi:MAG TPA: hypothetical protein VGH28_12260 [Polyangiaceae bacterium]|jgi:prolyl-tRNA editing enzyme YbaK/EbsC (Cys-tRNA(Pro) deacylase)